MIYQRAISWALWCQTAQIDSMLLMPGAVRISGMLHGVMNTQGLAVLTETRLSTFALYLGPGYNMLDYHPLQP